MCGKKVGHSFKEEEKKTHYVTSYEGNIVDNRSPFEEVKSDRLLFILDFSRLIVLRFQAYFKPSVTTFKKIISYKNNF